MMMNGGGCNNSDKRNKQQPGDCAEEDLGTGTFIANSRMLTPKTALTDENKRTPKYALITNTDSRTITNYHLPATAIATAFKCQNSPAGDQY